MTTPFSDKLRIVLKMLSMSSARLASELEVDKSVVSRWLKGSVQPSAHNLSRLSELVAKQAEGFRTMDWERDPKDIVKMFGAPPETITAAVRQSEAQGRLPIAIWDQMVSATALRGTAYEGFFRSTRPAPMIDGRFVHDHGVIRRDKIGLLRLTMGNAGTVVEGWMIPLHGQLYCISANVTNGTLLFGIFNGVGASRVEVFDGLILIPGREKGQSPTATAMVCHRIADLSGNEDADNRYLAELMAQNPLAPEGSVSTDIQKHLVRDFGPTQFALGGDWILNLPPSRSMARGPDFDEPPPPNE